MATIFTQIIKGEIPSHKIAESENYYSFLDINPISEGHTLVIPKKEVDYLFDLDDDTLSGLLKFAKPIAHALDRALGCMRTGIIVEGLEVPHAHIHLIPIYRTGQKVALGNNIQITNERMEELAAKIRSEVDK